jgi:hypothetical protein
MKEAKTAAKSNCFCSTAAKRKLNWIGPDKRGGLDGSTQHLLEVFLEESTRLISFAGVDSIETRPCLGSD